MKAWMVYRKPDADYNKHYIKAYQEEAKKYGVEIRLLYADFIDFGIWEGGLRLTYEGRPVKLPDFAIMRINYTVLSKHLELMGVKVYNSSMISEICNDKAKTFQYLAHLDVPMVPTVFSKHEFVAWKLHDSKENAIVAKAVDGHGGNQVFLYQPGIEGERERVLIIKRLNGSDAVIQPYFKNGNHDVRVFVIGREIIASVMRVSSQDFRSNYSLGGQARPYDLKKKEEEMVNKIIREFDFGMVGIDFLMGEDGGLVLNEIEDVVGARMLYANYEINLIDKYLAFMVDDMGRSR